MEAQEKSKNELKKMFFSGAHQASIEIQFSYYQSYIKAGSKVFESELKKYEEKLSEKNALGTPNNFPALLLDMFNSFVHSVNKEKIPHYFRTSSFLFLFSALEGQVKQVCDVVHRGVKGSESIDEFKNGKNGTSNVSKSKKYLNKYIQLEVENGLWKKIDDYQKIRNYIIHNNSNILKKRNVPLTQQALYLIVKGDKRLTLDMKSGSFVINTDDFLIEFCQTAKEYLLLISRQIFKSEEKKEL